MLWKNVTDMLERKILKYIEWFYRANKGALLLTGARQIGKTYSVRHFARKNFKSFIQIDFVKTPEAIAIFADAKGSDEILLRLSAFTSEPLILV